MISTEPASAPSRILILLLGSLGDTVVALPALHLIARRFPNSERRVLNHSGISAKAAAMSDILQGSGLVHGHFNFPAGMGRGRAAFELASEIRRWRPDLVAHLHEPRGPHAALRDWLFFKLCGARRIVGLRSARKPACHAIYLTSLVMNIAPSSSRVALWHWETRRWETAIPGASSYLRRSRRWPPQLSHPYLTLPAFSLSAWEPRLK